MKTHMLTLALVAVAAFGTAHAAGLRGNTSGRAAAANPWAHLPGIAIGKPLARLGGARGDVHPVAIRVAGTPCVGNLAADGDGTYSWDKTITCRDSRGVDINHAGGKGARKLSSGKPRACATAADKAKCTAACGPCPYPAGQGDLGCRGERWRASVVGKPVCLSDACFGPNGPDFSPSCGKPGICEQHGISSGECMCTGHGNPNQWTCTDTAPTTVVYYQQ